MILTQVTAIYVGRKNDRTIVLFLRRTPVTSQKLAIFAENIAHNIGPSTFRISVFKDRRSVPLDGRPRC
jgi:hypothetical protein